MTYKPSYYNIYSDILNKNNERIVFNSYSCKKLLISDYIYTSLSTNFLYELPIDVLQKLLKYNLIVTTNLNEVDSVLNENIDESKSDNMLYEAIQPTANCQLGCYYCGQKHTKDNFNEDLSEIVIERILNKLKINSKIKALSVGWFGGEPLIALPQIKKISQSLISYCKENNIEYSAKIATNGVSLTLHNFIELLNCSVQRIEITIDGTKEFHDKHRYYKAGTGSFDRIIHNLIQITNSKYFDKNKTQISIRCNVDESNVENINALINFLINNNLQEKIHIFYPVPIYSWGGNEAHKKSLNKITYSKYEIEWIKKLQANKFPVKLIPNRKKIVCLAVDKNAELIDTFGNIHNCTETSISASYDDTIYSMGNIKENNNITTQNAILSNWNTLLQTTNNFNCTTCQFLPICGGACPKSWQEEIASCPSFKFNFKERLKLLYQQKN